MIFENRIYSDLKPFTESTVSLVTTLAIETTTVANQTSKEQVDPFISGNNSYSQHESNFLFSVTDTVSVGGGGGEVKETGFEAKKGEFFKFETSGYRDIEVSRYSRYRGI